MHLHISTDAFLAALSFLALFHAWGQICDPVLRSGQRTDVDMLGSVAGHRSSCGEECRTTSPTAATACFRAWIEHLRGGTDEVSDTTQQNSHYKEPFLFETNPWCRANIHMYSKYSFWHADTAPPAPFFSFFFGSCSEGFWRTEHITWFSEVTYGWKMFRTLLMECVFQHNSWCEIMSFHGLVTVTFSISSLWQPPLQEFRVDCVSLIGTFFQFLPGTKFGLCRNILV